MRVQAPGNYQSMLKCGMVQCDRWTPFVTNSKPSAMQFGGAWEGLSLIHI